MEIIIRAAVMYLLLLLLLRLTTRRLMRTATPLDMALVFIFGGLATQAIILDDHSITASIFAMATISILHVAITLAKTRYPLLGNITDGIPIVIFRNGAWEEEALRQTRIQKSDVLVEVRQHGLRNLDEVQYAIIEHNGGITIIKK